MPYLVLTDQMDTFGSDDTCYGISQVVTMLAMNGFYGREEDQEKPERCFHC